MKRLAGLLLVLADRHRRPVDACAARAATADASVELVATLRSEPRSLNRLLASDRASLVASQLIHEPLVRVNHVTQSLEPALASSWTTLDDGRRVRLALRPDARFSDGSADDRRRRGVLAGGGLRPAPGQPARRLASASAASRSPRAPSMPHRRADVPRAVTVPACGRCTRCPSCRGAATRSLVADGTLAAAWTPTRRAAGMVGAGPFMLDAARAGRRHPPRAQSALLAHRRRWHAAAAGRPPPPRHRAVAGRRDAAPARPATPTSSRPNCAPTTCPRRVPSPRRVGCSCSNSAPRSKPTCCGSTCARPRRRRAARQTARLAAHAASCARPSRMPSTAPAFINAVYRGAGVQVSGHDHARQPRLACRRHRAAAVLARDGRRAARSHRRPRPQRRRRPRGRLQRAGDVHAARAAGPHRAAARRRRAAGGARQGRPAGRDRQPRRPRPAGAHGRRQLRRHVPRAAGLGHRPLRPDGVLAVVGTVPPVESGAGRAAAPSGKPNSTC